MGHLTLLFNVARVGGGDAGLGGGAEFWVVGKIGDGWRWLEWMEVVGVGYTGER